MVGQGRQFHRRFTIGGHYMYFAHSASHQIRLVTSSGATPSIRPPLFTVVDQARAHRVALPFQARHSELPTYIPYKQFSTYFPPTRADRLKIDR